MKSANDKQNFVEEYAIYQLLLVLLCMLVLVLFVYFFKGNKQPDTEHSLTHVPVETSPSAAQWQVQRVDKSYAGYQFQGAALLYEDRLGFKFLQMCQVGESSSVYHLALPHLNDLENEQDVPYSTVNVYSHNRHYGGAFELTSLNRNEWLLVNNTRQHDGLLLDFGDIVEQALLQVESLVDSGLLLRWGEVIPDYAYLPALGYQSAWLTYMNICLPSEVFLKESA